MFSVSVEDIQTFFIVFHVSGREEQNREEIFWTLQENLGLMGFFLGGGGEANLFVFSLSSPLIEMWTVNDINDLNARLFIVCLLQVLFYVRRPDWITICLTIYSINGKMLEHNE